MALPPNPALPLTAAGRPTPTCGQVGVGARATAHLFPSLPFQQFQALFNSLFKVLCIFPSRYLFAIGLPPVFSFGWSLPPTLSCNPKQLDSSKAGRTRAGRYRGMDGIVTLLDAHFQSDLAADSGWPRLSRGQFGPEGQIHNVSSSRFTRRYWGNPC